MSYHWYERIYNLFISHSWSYEDHYEGLVDLLNNDQSFRYKNYSVPNSDPIHDADNVEELKAAIKQQMALSSCILILAGVYSTYSKWINIEIELAKSGFLSSKPIVAVEPWGAAKTSTVVKNAADKIVGWRTKSVIDAIQDLC